LYGDQLAAGNEGICKVKLSHDVYVPSNNLSCQEDIFDNKSFIIERYRPTKKSCASEFDTTGILSFVIALIAVAKILFNTPTLDSQETPGSNPRSYIHNEFFTGIFKYGILNMEF